MYRKPRFSKNTALRDLQSRFIEFAEMHNNDDSLLEFVATEAAGGAYSARMISYVYQWTRRLHKSDFFTDFLKVLRKLKYDSPKMDEIQFRWWWSNGWREQSLELVAKAYQRWQTDSLEEAMKNMLRDETSEERLFRKAHLDSIPEDQRPYFKAEGHRLETN